MPGTLDIGTLIHDILAHQVGDIGWIVLFTIISTSLVFIYKISAASYPIPPTSSLIPPNYPHRPTLSLIPPNYLARSRQQKAQIVAAKRLEQCRGVIHEGLSKQGFPLKRLPPELQLLVLSYSADWPETYRALILVSWHVYNSTLRACLPIMPITLSSTKQLRSFAIFIHNKDSHHGFNIRLLIHRLWISPLQKEGLKHTKYILQACTDIRVLACTVRGLVAITKYPKLKHTMCRDLTLLRLPLQWDSDVALNTPSGLQFLRQLTHLRVMGEQSVPKTLSFDHLLYLSYKYPGRSCADSDMDDLEIKRPSALGNRLIFPSLRKAVLTRRCGVEEKAPLLCDARLVLLHVRRDLTEMEIWCNGSIGESLWQQAEKAFPAPNKPTIGQQ
ncbi:hypothetical protein H2248_011008 [Termitomyces sp. 'cryptogamus']|nr:hypothetical protein H2248_011008 [Termitomyces sp. 'cryptogamus']